MVKKTVYYCVPKNNLIKFKEDQEGLTISQEVLESEKLLENILKNGDVVDIEIGEIEVDGKKEQGIVKLVRANAEDKAVNTETKKNEPKVKEEVKKEESKTEVKKEEPKLETKKEEKPAEKKVEKVTKEILYVSDYGVKFVDEKSWTNFTKELQQTDFKKNGAIARNVIEATLEDGKIVEFKVVATPKEEKKETTRSSKNHDDVTRNSIERQTALNNAALIICEKIKIGAEEVNNFEKIRKHYFELAEVGISFIQS